MFVGHRRIPHVNRSQLRAPRSVLVGPYFYSIIKLLASNKVLMTSEHLMGFIRADYHLTTGLCLSQGSALANS